jgi:hypothetical protein
MIQTNMLGEQVIVRSDGMRIPFDPANTDYQQYLEWVAEGNTPEEWQPDQPSDTIEGDV